MKFLKQRKSLKEVNVKKLFRRNQIIITALAVMIAAAGYLNYAGKKEMETSGDDIIFEAGLLEISDEDILNENQAASYDLQPDAQPEEARQLAEIDSWDYEGEETGLDNPGEAVLTSGMSVSDYIAGVQLNREQIRAKNKETLNNIINNTNIDEAAKQDAIQSMIAMTAVSEKENAAETLLQAKGFADPVVSLTDGKVDVVINAAAITDPQRAQIEDIVKRKVGVAAEDIIITLLNLED